MPHLRCTPCEYGEYSTDPTPDVTCLFCGQRLDVGDVLALKDTQADRGTHAELRAAGYPV